MDSKDVARLQNVLIEHGSIYGAGICYICGVARCAIWVDAYDQLAAAGELMVSPSRLPARPPERSR